LFRVLAPRVITAALVATVACGCGSAHHPAVTPAPVMRPKRAAGEALARRPTSVKLRVVASRHLPSPVQLPAVALRGSTVFALGGLDGADASVATVLRVAPGRARPVGSLPAAVHDTGAAVLGNRVYAFGGGTATGPTDAIVELGGGTVGRLPEPSSDLEAVRSGKSILVIGGYTGAQPSRTVLSFTPGKSVRVVAQLPHPLRYAAAAAVNGGAVLVAGGTDGAHAQSAVVRIAHGRARVIGRLPEALSHVAGAALGGTFYVIGGRTDTGVARRAIWAVDPHTGDVRAAGRLPAALSDAAAVATGGGVLVVGGRTASGHASDRIWELARG
jgi:hypothetical protein